MAEPGTIFDWLVARYPQASRSTVRRLIADGRVRLAGKPVRSLKEPLKPGDKPVITDKKPRSVVLPQGLKAIYQDADLLVVEKPAGLLTATDENETRPTVLALAEQMLSKGGKQRMHLVHRLDKDASGLLVLARGIPALANLKQQFRRHSITREYELIVHGKLENARGALKNNLRETADGRVEICPAPAGKPAMLDYRILRGNSERTLVRCRLYTGRKHQIRVQFAFLGHPIVGDPVYGTPMARRGSEGRLALHAVRLSLVHPRTKKTMDFVSQFPVEFTT
jgi:23S rRNA pseudouridine1911/1915/1917 synthase